jgi:hypothetical protein
MSILSIGARGKITGYTHYADAVGFLVQMFEGIENWSKHVGADNIEAGAIGTTKLLDGSVTQAKVAEGVGRILSGTYTGDGTTANRVINIGVTWTPKRVVVLRTDATAITFETISSSGDTRAWYRAAAGTFGNSTTHWQGAVATGFKLGSSATGDSNAAGVTYSWYAEG